jgi:hypothetical protein
MRKRKESHFMSTENYQTKKINNKKEMTEHDKKIINKITGLGC